MRPELVGTGATVAPLSTAQERLWLIDQSAPGSPLYSVPLLLRWSGPVDLDSLRVALDGLVARHDVLRTTYHLRENRIMQVVAEHHVLPIEVVDGVADVRADALRRSREGFDLAAAPPTRCVVWRGGPDGDAVLLVIHHIAVDGWSLAPLFEDLTDLYRAGSPPSGGLRYVDYAQWERQLLDDPALREQLLRRADTLAGGPGPARLGGARPMAETVPEGGRPGRQVVFDIDEHLVTAADEFSRHTRSTPFTVFLLVYLETLRRWAGRTEFVIGTYAVNRPHPGLERLVGFFVNTVPLVLVAEPGTFRELVAVNRTEALAALRHQRLPFDRLTAEVAARGRRGLADLGFAYQNFPPPAADAPLWTFELLHTGTAKADLLLIVEKVGTAARGTVEFATDRYPDELGGRFAADYHAVLSAVLADPDRPLSEVRLPYGPLATTVAAPAAAVAGDAAPPRALRTASELFRTTLSTVDGLAIGAIGSDDNFFALGGNSLLAITMLAGAADVSPREFLADPTVAGLARLLARSPATTAPPAPDRSVTPTQERMWLQDRMSHLRAAYLVPSVVEFGDGVDADRLAVAVDRVLAHHPALRSRFRLDRASKRVAGTDGPPARTAITDVAGWPADKLADHVAALCWTPFALATEAPARAEILAGDTGCVLVLCAHHIVFDGTSRQLVFDQIGAAYRGEPLPDPTPHPPASKHTDPAQLLAALAGAPTDIALPHDRPRGARQSIAAAAVRRGLDPGTSLRLRAAGAASGCSLFLTTAALAAATLARYSEQRDFLFVFPWSDRPAGAGVGMFVNTVPLRVDLRDVRTWREALERVAAAGAVGYRHADAPFADVAAALHPERDLSRPPVTPVYVDAASAATRPPDLGVPAHLKRLTPLKAKHELEFLALDAGDAVEFELTYLTDLFDRATAEAMADTLLSAAMDLAADSRSPLMEPR